MPVDGRCGLPWVSAAGSPQKCPSELSSEGSAGFRRRIPSQSAQRIGACNIRIVAW